MLGIMAPIVCPKTTDFLNVQITLSIRKYSFRNMFTSPISPCLFLELPSYSILAWEKIMVSNAHTRSNGLKLKITFRDSKHRPRCCSSLPCAGTARLTAVRLMRQAGWQRATHMHMHAPRPIIVTRPGSHRSTAWTSVVPLFARRIRAAMGHVRAPAGLWLRANDRAENATGRSGRLTDR